MTDDHAERQAFAEAVVASHGHTQPDNVLRANWREREDRDRVVIEYAKLDGQDDPDTRVVLGLYHPLTDRAVEVSYALWGWWEDDPMFETPWDVYSMICEWALEAGEVRLRQT